MWEVHIAFCSDVLRAVNKEKESLVFLNIAYICDWPLLLSRPSATWASIQAHNCEKLPKNKYWDQIMESMYVQQLFSPIILCLKEKKCIWL